MPAMTRRSGSADLPLHGGRVPAWLDRHPFPVPTRVYDHTIGVLKAAVRNARLGREERLQALRRLDAQARALERTAAGPSVEAFVADELRQSHADGGRSVSGWEPAPAPVRGATAAAADNAR